MSDSRTGQTDSESSVLAPFNMHIGYDQEGNVNATGTVTIGMIELTYNQVT
ncbi:hypothetical protein [Methylobacterium mesophilicum]